MVKPRKIGKQVSRKAKRAKQELVAPDGVDAPDEDVPGPSTNPATNLMLADVAVRAGSYIVRDVVEKGFLRGRYGKQTAKEIVQNKTLGSQIIGFGLAKLATRNLPGALLVGGGVAVKALYDRAQSRKAAKRKGDRELLDLADKD